MGDGSSTSRHIGQQTSASTTDLTIRRVSQMIGQPVRNAQGERLGTIYDVVLTPDLNQISYVALSRGGIFGIGRDLHAIPWDSMKLGASGTFIAPISKDELNQWRGFRSSAWPADASGSWVSGTARPAVERQTVAERRSVQDRRVSRIKGINVKTADGRNAGDLRDLVVATDTGRVLYSIVSHGGLLGIGARESAVPRAAIDLQPDLHVARLNVGKDVLRENSFAPGRFPDLGDPGYARSIDRAYGIESGQTVLGYVPAEEPQHRMPAPETTRPETNRAPATGDMGTIRIDPNASFDAAATKTIEGVVTMVGKSARTVSGVDLLLLQVRTDDGVLHTVYAGPLNYVAKQDFYAVNGDRVTVMGAPARGDSSLFLATRISKDGQVLTLRNREGKPLWEHLSEAGQHPEATTHTPGQDMGKPSQDQSYDQMDETPTP
jgi:sporulation protein YlmC with PRC-barrel domain